MSFSLLTQERTDLLESIAKEAVQMKNAIENIESNVWLKVVLSINPPPNNFSYISSISLCGNEAKKSIFAVGEEAAEELYEKLSHAAKLTDSEKELEKVLHDINSDDWRRMSQMRDEDPALAARYILRPSGSKHRRQLIEPILSKSDSYEEFNREVGSLASQQREEAQLVREKPLERSTVGTFAGQESSVPAYVERLLGSLAALKVLHLADRRKQIGQEEAQ